MQVKRVLTRVYVNDIEPAIEFYEGLFKEKLGNRFKYAQVNLELAQVGSVLIIAGTDEALEPFRGTDATFLVDSIAEYKGFLLKNGAGIIRDVQPVPTGFNMIVRHPDGTVVEYVEHRS